jgi:outer membrane protein assembly factor BamE (lipoprotein component of BamABCDE complex)
MRQLQKTFLIGILLLSSACSILQPVTLNPGETEAEVIAKLGNPSARMLDNGGFVLEYNHNPWGQAINMARFDSEHRLISYEQVLTTETFATIKPGISTKSDVLRIIGHPSETAYFPRMQLEAWTYPYKEQGTWNSLMHIYFNNSGVVHRLENGQDLRFDRDGKFGFGW